MEAKILNLQPILPEDFDVRLLRSLAREGRLYFDANEPTDLIRQADRQQEVLGYVSAINEYASRAYVPYITSLWLAIIDDPVLNDNLFLQKGRHQGMVNRYRVLAIVTILLENGVYDRSHTLLELHHRLQHTTRKDSVYSSRLNYALSHTQCMHLRRLAKNFLDNEAV